VYEIQDSVFRWALHQSQVTSLVLFGLGILFGLQGFRFARVLLSLTCAAGGFILGGVTASLLGLPLFGPSLVLAGVLGAVSLWHFRLGVALAAMFTFGAVASYLAGRFDVSPSNAMFAGLGGVALGSALFYLYLRQTPILITTVLGAGLMIVGFLGLISRLAPSLADTFVRTADEYPVMTPVLGVMLCVLGFSVQANAAQGDVKTGGGGFNRVELQ
jgi:hypothetical protein